MRYGAHIKLLAQVLIVCAALVFLVTYSPSAPAPAPVRTDAQPASAAAPASSTPEFVEASEAPTPSQEPEISNDRAIIQDGAEVPQPSNAVSRIANPYPTPPIPFETINELARRALVNIFCMPTGSGPLRPIVGSGVFIDPRGVILTNAHVAQYVLLSQVEGVNLSCVIRAGSPAVSRWYAQVLFMPPVWVQEHAADITSARPVGTGAHDYALLYITGNTDGTPLIARAFPFLPLDTREAIGFVDDPVLVASYPAEFAGPLAAQRALHSASTITTIQNLFTLEERTVDVHSLGGVIGAQSGSSGGAVANAWGRLIGLITTTSDGETTGDRDLRSISLSYIDRDLARQSGLHLDALLRTDLMGKVSEFATQVAPPLAQLLIEELSR